MRFGTTNYSAEGFFDELIQADGTPRPHANLLAQFFGAMQPEEFAARQAAVDSTIVDMGISFTLYSQGDNIDRAWPLDIVPRAMSGAEWDPARYCA